jgi:hypothetical protein
MSKAANDFESLKPIYKESYAGEKKNTKKQSFDKLRKKLLKDWKPKKVGL